jgi:thiamine-phosphate pyrophosphorylase
MAKSCLLYYITDRTAFPGNESARCKRLLEKISEAAIVGIDYIQLREKDLPTRELESLAKDAAGIIAKLRTENRERRPALLINSRTDVAIAVQTDGVHLRSDDISPQEVRAIWKQGGAGELPGELSARDPLIGVSCHSPADVIQAAATHASFAVFAPVYEKIGSLPAGLSLLREACQNKIPVLALGGVTLSNARACLAAGAAGIAAIRLFQENDIEAVARKLRSL